MVLCMLGYNLTYKEEKKGESKMDKSEIIEELAKRGYRVAMKEIVKNGVVFDGIEIVDGNPISLIICAEKLIEVAEKERKSVSEMVDLVVQEYEKHRTVKSNIDQFLNKEFVISHVYIGIQKKSAENIEKKPCELDGLESYLYIRYEKSGKRYSVKLSPDLLKTVGVDIKELWSRAQDNTFSETKVESVAWLLAESGNMSFREAEMEMKSEFPKLYVVFNKIKYRGASAILNKAALRDFAKKHGVNKLFVMPSSIHEMLIMPYDNNINLDDLSGMVAEVNGMKVEPEERLTNRAYLIEV